MYDKWTLWENGHFINETKTNMTGYLICRRRSPENGGITAVIGRNKQTYIIDNRWIVLYSPVLLKAFKEHINVELWCSLQAIIYIMKFINKGWNTAILRLGDTERNEDEVDYFKRKIH